MWERCAGPASAPVAAALNNLARTYEDEGAFARAEPLMRRALAIREAVFGPEHPETAPAVRDLACLVYRQRRFADAVPLLERAVAMGQKALRSPLDIAKHRAGL